MNWYLTVLKRYAEFSGRSRRKEYWMFFLINILISLVLGAIEGMIGLAPDTPVSVLAMLYSLAVLIPGIAVAVRRLHDTGRSGWWLFIGLVPFVGGIVLLVLLALDGESGSNQYGANPKGFLPA